MEMIPQLVINLHKTILGNTLTTEQGENGARSLGEVHANEQKGKEQSDASFILSILNTKFRAILKTFGINATGGNIWFDQPDTDWLEVQTKWNVISSVAQRVPVDDDYIYEEIGIPKPDNYDQLKAEKEERRRQMMQQIDAEEEDTPADGDDTDDDTDNDTDDNTDEDTDKKLPKKKLSARLADFFGVALAERALSGKARTRTNDTDLAARVWNGESDYWDSQLFKEIADNLISALDRQQATLAVDTDYGITDDVMRVSMEQNLWHFSAAKTLAEVQALNQALNAAKDYNAFRLKANKITDTFNKRWQQTEYQTAVNCAENASTYLRLIKKGHIFPFWQYKTAGDDKVREEHAGLDGVTLRYDDELWDSIYPPNGWKCRCYVVPKMKNEVNVDETQQQQRVKDYKKTPDWKKVVAQHWGINRAKQGLVFTNNQMYIRKFPDNATSYMDKVKPVKWGLENSVKKLQQKADRETSTYAGTAEEFWNTHKQVIDGTEYLVVKDYNGREWMMKKKAYNVHTTNVSKNREYRIKYLNEIFEVVKNPDEVWLGRDEVNRGNDDMKLSNFNLIKYYKDTTLVVSLKVVENKLQFKTWFELINTDKRSGLLVKRR